MVITVPLTHQVPECTDPSRGRGILEGTLERGSCTAAGSGVSAGRWRWSL